jgi:hypothetical protein|tara:strand:+ start:697 stop:798 length:102 start_codon:yes stop_codon:yes gene_type:complete
MYEATPTRKTLNDKNMEVEEILITGSKIWKDGW